MTSGFLYNRGPLDALKALAETSTEKTSSLPLWPEVVSSATSGSINKPKQDVENTRMDGGTLLRLGGALRKCLDSRLGPDLGNADERGPVGWQAVNLLHSPSHLFTPEWVEVAFHGRPKGVGDVTWGLHKTPRGKGSRHVGRSCRQKIPRTIVLRIRMDNEDGGKNWEPGETAEKKDERKLGNQSWRIMLRGRSIFLPAEISQLGNSQDTPRVPRKQTSDKQGSIFRRGGEAREQSLVGWTGGGGGGGGWRGIKVGMEQKGKKAEVRYHQQGNMLLRSKLECPAHSGMKPNAVFKNHHTCIKQWKANLQNLCVRVRGERVRYVQYITYLAASSSSSSSSSSSYISKTYILKSCLQVGGNRKIQSQ
ncbi:hypothetical protein QBC43DRAFT_336042 [Cladorrhinum sp. PSN259]|nr:hypothetical protein QBC43DRAFT_336042 [Cladorrhinum sp. PSN259]